ncbi:hypothetical protein [Xenorhabdus bovienii]|uniref:hypothetical protein n=1 Tax=Xenorhabdus bovienii TaxID=40576 RepID=UPI0023B2EC83|nr:hypothetical protein [Xenorhabdus bovienii]MDE9466866.1 hypothetical protein [Xenorhabdus bovienii]
MKMKNILLGLVLSILSLSSWAVDGYKGVKFGSSIDDVINSKLCTIVISGSDVKGVTNYRCDDFDFAEKKTLAYFSFINGEFKRLIIRINPSVGLLVNSLEAKYGSPSFQTSEEDIKRSVVTSEPRDIMFDKNTIIVSVKKINGSDVALLSYTDPNYSAEYNALSNQKYNDDI